MLVLALAFLGGVLTILSPCILPVVPLVFARSDKPFWRSTFPVLVGMAASFALLAAASVAGGHWIVRASQAGRTVALVVFAAVGLSLVSSRLAELLARPFVRLGAAVQGRATDASGPFSALLVGASLGFLWAPCAGPILGLVLAGASFGAPSAKTLGLLFAFAAGAATSLGMAVFAGGRLLSLIRRGVGAEAWLKRGIGFLVLGAVFAIALHADTVLLAAVPKIDTTAIEQRLVARVTGGANTTREGSGLTDEGPAPALDGATAWISSPPLTLESLRGKVVLVDFWTYSCINCLRTLPYLKSWAERYGGQGLVVVGVHTPEFAFERDVGNVKKAAAELGIRYPIAIDDEQRIWSAYRNRYWPAHYFVDAKGRIRHHHFGEGAYEESERVIVELLAEAKGGLPIAATTGRFPGTGEIASGTGVEAPPSDDVRSPETYVGYGRQSRFVSSPAVARDTPVRYSEPSSLAVNQWSAAGTWKFSREMASLEAASGALSFRFFARDVNVVLGAPSGRSVRYRVTVDGKPPGADHGEDTDTGGNGVVHDHRLYQVLRQARGDRERVIRIQFLDQGAEVFAFTFG